eukprot:scaffold2457_cov47-Cyclotella_meneghiniana.AAC.1
MLNPDVINIAGTRDREPKFSPPVEDWKGLADVNGLNWCEHTQSGCEKWVRVNPQPGLETMMK